MTESLSIAAGNVLSYAGINRAHRASFTGNRTGLLLLAVAAGAIAKDEGEKAPGAEQPWYARRHTFLQEAMRLTSSEAYHIGAHTYKRPGRPEEHAPAQTIVQFFTNFGPVSFHYLGPVEETRRLLSARFGVEAPQPWDGIALQPHASTLLVTYIHYGIDGIVRWKAAQTLTRKG